MSEHHRKLKIGTQDVQQPSIGNNRPCIQTVYSSAESFQCEPLFNLIEETLKKDGPKYVEKIKAVFAFNVIDGPGGSKERWLVNVKHGNGSVQKGGKGKADCTFTMKDKDLVNIMTGKLQPPIAFFGGKLKIIGNVGLAMKLQQIMPKHPKAKL
ncbi:sterol carrier protein 2-like isoform X2 [Apostichopus japonicus]